MTILVTGGAGFIGSHFTKMTLKNGNRVVVLDKLTYAGNLENLKEIKNHPNFRFYKGDICNKKLVEKILKNEGPEVIINFAAETHVDRSILDAEAFIDTDVKGTFVLLQAARKFPIKLFIQVSTDEVYGSIPEGSFKETDALNPSSPYSASKAAGDRLAYSYWVTYKSPVIILRPCNIYGPNQYPEKFIPLFITNAIEGKPLPLYGDGKQVRDWLYVTDLCEAIELIIQKGALGEVYNIAASNEKNNLEIAQKIVEILGKDKSLIQHVKDREGHDRRYSMSSSKVLQLGWKPRVNLEQGLKETIQWYLNNRPWWEKIKRGRYSKYYQKQYAHRV
ncbi:MAG TPA: dTDP-glucose 4,6-dehydratase [Candidatus Hypogeohydataceae bacterium YC41]